MITGGLVGFLIGLVCGLAEQSSWPSILWRASVGAVIAGLLMRWWGSIWVDCLERVRHSGLAQPAESTSPAPSVSNSAKR